MWCDESLPGTRSAPLSSWSVTLSRSPLARVGPGDYERSLTAASEQQAELLVTDPAALSPTVIFSSPYLRAVRTIQPLARRTGLPIETDHDLREWESGIGPTPGYARYYCESWAEPSLARPGGESLRQLSDRAAAILTTLAHRHPVAAGTCATPPSKLVGDRYRWTRPVRMADHDRHVAHARG
ncbi:histidine phosphatase family protein [Nocardia sp. NPDC059691]|uniref:histidine phosphatase family protein n=1 Tax=Nocardia sp. NPDC059691 TaxID=3346908 RepID=UPI003693A3E3